VFERGITGLNIPGAVLTKRPLALLPKQSSRRTKVWELGGTLHCSIVGTCLTTGELRGLLRKSDTAIDRQATDHDLHSLAVAAVGSSNETAKQIQKTLDRHHKLVVERFGRAENAHDLGEYWDEAVRKGDIPGAYWALLTHPLATDPLVRRAFGDVHMLSHLVGAANRADIHRLHELEQQKAALEEKLARQQNQLRYGIVARELKIRDLSAALSARIERERASAPGDPDHSSESAALDGLVADLRKQLDLEIRRRERAEKKAQELIAAHAAADATRIAMERELTALRDELDAAEAGLAAFSGEGDRQSEEAWNLAGLTILYVGGRPHQVARLRSLVERASGQFMHHDGGIEDRGELLAGLVSRADVGACPIDRVSHAAALAVKRLCRQAGKSFVPLRSSGVASLLRAVRSAEFRLAVSGAD
jgi:Uncharacterized protein conserved in bacteria (DUF2325)